jgi:SagB-type dehydrogenase family enzyme
VTLLTCQVVDTIHIEWIGDDGSAEGSSERQPPSSVVLEGRLDVRRRPLLVPGTRVYLDGDGKLRLCPLLMAMTSRRDPGGTTLLRTQREVILSGELATVWTILGLLDGRRRVEDVLAEIDPQERVSGMELLATLERLGVVDASGRALRRFIYNATTYRRLPVRGLDPAQLARLVCDGNYRSYPDARKIALPPDPPSSDALRAFRSITHSRRSPERFARHTMSLQTLSAVLQAACGVTGTKTSEFGAVALRAHPAAGALYSVQVYPVVLNVAGLDPGVYHYDPLSHQLEIVRAPIEEDDLLAASDQRETVRNAAVVYALSGDFKRFERKYGSNGYRTFAMEAGHISQNLILATVAAGDAARPIGSWYEDALNRLLGFESYDERYLLAILAGRASTNPDDRARPPGIGTSSGEG